MLHSCGRSGSILAFCLLLLLFPGHLAVTFAAGPERIIPNPQNQQRIQEIVNEFMAKLTMADTIAVALVPKNPLMVSVEYTDTSTGFLLSVEEDFINELTQEELAAFCRNQIATYKLPRYWKLVDAFPMTVTGKVQKFRLREMAIEVLGRHDAANEKTA